MKKRLTVILFLITMMTLLLSGCTDKKAKESELSVSENSEESKNEEPIAAPVSVTFSTDRVIQSTAYNSIVFINKEGMPEVVETPKEKPYSNGVVLGSYDDIILMRGDDYSCMPGYSYVAAVNKDTLDVKEILRIGEGEGKYLRNVSVFEGKVYITLDNFDTGEPEVHIFNATTFEETNEATDFFSNIKGYSLVSNGEDYYFKECYLELLHIAGYVVLQKDDAFYSYDGNVIERIEGLPKEVDSVIGYDADKIFFSLISKDTYEVTGLGEYDIDTKLSETFVEGNALIKGFYDGRVFYSIQDNTDYGNSLVYVYCYDSVSKETESVCTLKEHHGVDSYYLGSEGFKVIDGIPYFIYDDGKTIGWYRGDKDEPTSLNIPLFESELLKYGQVEVVSKTEKCEFCDAVLLECYEEYFKLDEEYSPFAGKINEELKKIAENDIEMLSDDIYSVSNASDCEKAGHGMYYCKITQECDVYKAQIMADNYLYVSSSGYWYGGGAHGMPFVNTCMYDLTTGETVSLKDFYKGTEEEFKDLIARKTMEDFETYDVDDSPYFAADSDEVYEQAYNYISFDNVPFIISEDGVYINYPPYEMGSYAAGYISVLIDFDDLGMESFK